MSVKEIIEKNKKAILLMDIELPVGDGKKKLSIRGTGFIVSKDGKFITSAHVYKKIPKNELPYLGVKAYGRTDDESALVPDCVHSGGGRAFAC